MLNLLRGGHNESCLLVVTSACMGSMVLGKGGGGLAQSPILVFFFQCWPFLSRKSISSTLKARRFLYLSIIDSTSTSCLDFLIDVQLRLSCVKASYENPTLSNTLWKGARAFLGRGPRGLWTSLSA